MEEEQLYTIFDGSFSFVIPLPLNGPPTNEHGIYLQKRRFRILYSGERNLPFTGFDYLPGCQNNDTIVQDVDDLSIVFTRKDFLRKLRKRCSCCGQELPE